MRACASSCAHRLWVQEHRADRAAWEVKRDNGGLGYAEETRDWERENPGPLLKDKMLHREKAPEMPTLDSSIGNPTAEEALIATALFSQKGAAVLRTLDPEEFQQPLNRHIAKAIGHLESYGVRASAVAVETYMRGEDQNIPGMIKSRTGILHGQLSIARIARSTEWDSSLPLGNVDRTQYGLQHLEATANPTVMAHSFRDEIHNQWIATKTQEAYQWGAQVLQSAHESPEGTTPETTRAIEQQTRQKINGLGRTPDIGRARALMLKAQKIPRLTPAPSLPSQQVSTTRSLRRA